MARVLLLGYTPPPLMGQAKVQAMHYRTWQFLEPLLDDGHIVCLCADQPDTPTLLPTLPAEWAKHLVYHQIPFRRQPGWVAKLQKIHDTFNPDCIVAVNFEPCLCATKLRTDKPIWMDIYGDYLTIIQAARYRAGSDRGISTSIGFVRRVLQKGDIFSACGTPQRHALVGELAMAGRLNSHTFGYEFTRVILPGARSTSNHRVKREARPFLNAFGVTSEDFVVLWCGGYNTWTDVKTLFAGLELAMAQDPRVHFVSVGANSYEAPDNVYTQFLALIEKSPYRDRFHMAGWRPWTEIPDYYHESDVGLNIDALHYETIYGTRTRLVEMIAAGMPVITSLGCEISELLRDRGAGLAFAIGDWQDLGRHILTLSKNCLLRERMAKSAIDYANNDLSFAAATTPLRIWVRNPQVAPDKKPVTFKEKLGRLEYQTRSAARGIIWQIAGLDKV